MQRLVLLLPSSSGVVNLLTTEVDEASGDEDLSEWAWNESML